MKIEPLSLLHQDVLTQKFKLLDLSLSEYSFANLYLFRKVHDYQVIHLNGEIFLKGMTRDKVSFIMLTSHPAQLSPQLLQEALSLGEVFFPVPESWLSTLEKYIVRRTFKDEDSDYLFASSKLASFPGRHLSKKRNLVKQLFSDYEIKGEDLSDQQTEAFQILENWQRETNPTFETDFEQCQEAIESLHRLRLHGRIIYADGKGAGFTIGEKISTDCYALHFCKGLRSITGLNQHLYQDAAQSVEKMCSWINLEQDLGLPPLRNAKGSYLPDLHLKKWRLQLKL